MSTPPGDSATGAVLAGADLPLQNEKAPSVDLPDVVSGANPLTAAANPVLNLVPQIRGLLQLEKSPADLREYLVEKIKAFEREAKSQGVAPDIIIGARYCLCTLLDETAAQTPWGGFGAWAKLSLLVTFHNETWGGEKFFQLLSKLAQNPQQHRDLLALMYYCLCLGFEGRFRVVDNGKAQLETLRQRLWQILRDSSPERHDTLSPHWRGENDSGNHGWRLLPAWVVASVALLIGTLIYVWFTFALASQSDKVFAQIGAVRLAKAPIPIPPKPAPQRMAKFLEPEVQEGLVTVRDQADRSVVTLRGDGLFASGSATVLDRYLPTLRRIAEALNTIQGNVIVSGYTDNVPIRTLQYPSNFHLSQDRANHVVGILARGLEDTSRIRSQGLGESDPIAPNDSAENRARNRRVEIVLMLAPTVPSAQ
ncbi:MAG: DotU family type VI secretion system protein [Burkholderiaceae bacterium]|jgi:type VI secretion system protein ImpK|nr:DotU family type VI secretion system protein [Burkholderiaceae bacterium]